MGISTHIAKAAKRAAETVLRDQATMLANEYAATELHLKWELPPVAQRLGVIAGLQRKLQELEAEHSQIVEEAAAEGIELELLPHVAQRRQAAHESTRDAKVPVGRD